MTKALRGEMKKVQIRQYAKIKGRKVKEEEKEKKALGGVEMEKKVNIRKQPTRKVREERKKGKKGKTKELGGKEEEKEKEADERRRRGRRGGKGGRGERH